ncbi:MAG: FHA domain-containing protein [Anaerolineae bacterium]|nr:FHA domain-containing protein [Anaerolineae bacterium]
MADDVAKLMVKGGMAGQGRREILLAQDVTTLGRAPSCQVVIENDFASRRHAQIIKRDQLYWLKDLGSKNGTLLNNEPVTAEVLLSDGAEVRIGEAVFVFVDLAVTRTHPGVAVAAEILRVEASAREVWVHGQKLTPRLSLKQFDLLNYLYLRAGEAVSKDEIIAAVWPETETDAIYDYQVDKMVSRVRERIGKEWIETVWGYGYRLRLK